MEMEVQTGQQRKPRHSKAQKRENKKKLQESEKVNQEIENLNVIKSEKVNQELENLNVIKSEKVNQEVENPNVIKCEKVNQEIADLNSNRFQEMEVQTGKERKPRHSKAQKRENKKKLQKSENMNQGKENLNSKGLQEMIMHPSEQRKPSNKTTNRKKKFNQKVKKAEKVNQEIENLNSRRLQLSEVNVDNIQHFVNLPLSKKTCNGLKNAGFTIPTRVQRQSLVFSLRGLDVVAAAKTGSGKTLAFIVPLLETLYLAKWTQMDGLGALVITPTRELAYQIFEVLNKVGREHDFSAGLVIGGKDLKHEWSRIRLCNILICTPGRLLQHMTENPDFNCDNIQMLVLDEADNCLSMGFADTMNCILEEVPEERQTLLFSATQTRDVRDLIRAGCKKPVFCSVHELSKTTTPKTLKQSYVLCEAHDKFTFLWSFMKHHKKHKILVFLSTCKQVQYMFNMFCKLQPGLSVMGLHGSMHQLRRMAVYDEFCRKTKAILFATDVAARGLDIPDVDWVIQADCPEDVTTYIHRVGRTARYTNSGEAILLLSSAEEPAMLAKLKAKNIPIEKTDVDPSKLQSINIKIEAVLSKYNNLKEEAVRAFKLYLKHVELMKDKKIFNVLSIDLDAFARSLGLGVTPRVRFLEKKLKQKFGSAFDAKNNNEKVKLETTQNSRLKTLKFGADDSDDDDDDFLMSSKKSGHHVNFDILEETENEEQPNSQGTKKVKVKTKAAVAKKLLKKNLQLNQKIVFDEEGEKILDPTKEQVSRAAQEGYEQTNSGINIASLQEVMKEEDAIDKKIHAERLKEKNRIKKKKKKANRANNEHEMEEMEGVQEEEETWESGADDSDMDDLTKNIIDELPDPDQYYGKDGVRDERSDDEFENKPDENRSKRTREDESSSEEESESEEQQPKISGKKRARARAQEAKRARMAQSNNLGNLPVEEQEQLALFLLRGRK